MHTFSAYLFVCPLSYHSPQNMLPSHIMYSLHPKLNLCVLILANNVNLRLIKKYADFIKHHIFLGHNPKLSPKKKVDRGSTFSLRIQPSIIESQETSLFPSFSMFLFSAFLFCSSLPVSLCSSLE